MFNFKIINSFQVLIIFSIAIISLGSTALVVYGQEFEVVTVAENLENKVKGIGFQRDFVYDTKGSMAKIGKKDGVALLLGHEFRGFLAWLIWKQYYLSTLPTNEKKIRVGIDWFIDLFFPRDITRLSNVYDEKSIPIRN